jgi:hypothetical protein
MLELIAIGIATLLFGKGVQEEVSGESSSSD